MASTDDGVRFETLTGLELRRISKAIGRPLEQAARDGDLEVAFALEWIRRTRSDPDVTYEEVLGQPLEEIIHHLDGLGDADPT